MTGLPELPRVGEDALRRSQAQARLQAKGGEVGETLWEFVPPERDDEGQLVPDRGLLALPEPSEGDLYFDIEGARYYSEDGKEFGLQYLFGVVDSADLDANDIAHYRAFWALDRAGEKRAFGELVDFLMERRLAHPAMHVYHYNHYEPTSVTHLADLHETREDILGRLMGRFATREDEVDDLFTQSVFVDLYRVVRQGVRASVESYSIKRLESLCGYNRRVPLVEVNEHMVPFELALEARTASNDTQGQDLIAGYNEDDCRATQALHSWLEARRQELETQLGPLPRPQPPEATEDRTDPEVRQLRSELFAEVPEEESERTPEQRARALASDLLEWHRREDKPRWWRWFYMLRLNDEELIDERDALSGLEFIGVAATVKRSHVLEFRFPPQEHPFESGDKGLDRSERGWRIEAVDEGAGTIRLMRGVDSKDPYPSVLIGRKIIPAGHQRRRLLDLGIRVRDLPDAGWPHDATLDLLLRRHPNIPGNGPLRRPGEEASEAGARLALLLARSFLPVQGPPGTGKTYTGAQQIIALVRQGKQVGVVANSHAVISNLLDEAELQATKGGLSLRIGQRTPKDEPSVSTAARVQDNLFTENAKPLAALQGRALDVLGGTPWLWAIDDYANAVDTLIVDEASQVSLANALAVAHAAENLILLGDPQQLGQPSQAAQPPGADASALGHVLQDDTTMPPERGLFIERTRRMHPAICRFTSEVFYQSRLHPMQGLEHQAILGTDDLDGAGLKFVPIAHEGNSNSSPEEADAVVELVRALGRGTWRDAKGSVRPITTEEVLVVTPFNAQIREISRAFDRAGVAAVRIGTVDKFQGRQAAAVIYSMASSSAEDAPRGMEFLFQSQRLNVATSRARCLAIIVASPELIRVTCRTPRQMQLVNALCRFEELSRGTATGEI